MPRKFGSNQVRCFGMRSRLRRGGPAGKLQWSRRVANWVAPACLLLFALPAASHDVSRLPELSRAATRGQFISAVGRRAALLGNKEGQLEAWVYPLKILRGLHLRFHVDGRILQAEPLAQTVITRPESSTIVYGDGSFQVRETLFVPVHEPGAMIAFEIQTERPFEIEVAFKTDFQLAWPASIGPSHFAWDSTQHAFIFAAQNYPYAALVGSPTASDAKLPKLEEDDRADSSSAESSFLLGVTHRGKDHKLVCFAASLRGQDDAAEIYALLPRQRKALIREATNYYRDDLDRTLNLALPDAEMQQAYDWARINLLQAMVENPLVGTGLIAGYGPSGESERPGFDWFFGRDALWSSLALDSEGDFTDAKAALEFLAKYQRADGKIPHEVPQSATLIPWFEDYPYGYASADATPLFLIALCDYVERSGDVSFAQRKWDSIWLAYQFLDSTLDADGFAQNLGAGHGWVESGPLVPVRTEIYQAALGIEALQATSALAGRLGKQDIAARLDERFRRQRARLNELFWSSEKNIFAFALDANSRRVEEETVLPAVPMWFGLLDPVKAAEMIARLAAPEIHTDWGERMLSSSSDKYSADGYHFGSVWPLFTGWASVGEYRYHQELAAYLDLRANALLALDGSAGHITEVLNGDRYEPLPTSTPQQTWSAAMIVSPLLQGLLGLEINLAAGEITWKPHVPARWDSFAISNLHVGSVTLALRFRKDAGDIWLEITRSGSGKCALDFSPALSLRAHMDAATLNRSAIPYRMETNNQDQHASVHFEVPAGKSTLRLRFRDDFELSIAPQLPPPGSASRGLRILSSTWTPERDRLTLEVAGVPGSNYEFSLSDASQIVSVEGAELHKSDPRAPKLQVKFSARPDVYVQRRVTLQFGVRHRATSARK
jgi:GH15 family glucan-1,4-alpha-glucosidase